jgi:hypothetical protein
MKVSANALTKICSPSFYIDTVKPSGKLNQLAEENKGVPPPDLFQKRTEIIIISAVEWGSRIRLIRPN